MPAADKAHVAADADLSAPAAALPVARGPICPVGFWSADRPLGNTAPDYTILCCLSTQYLSPNTTITTQKNFTTFRATLKIFDILFGTYNILHNLENLTNPNLQLKLTLKQ